MFPSVLAGLGLGFSFVPVTIASVSGTREDEAGLASGLINTSQQVGGALGLGILVSIANSRTSDLATVEPAVGGRVDGGLPVGVPGRRPASPSSARSWLRC